MRHPGLAHGRHVVMDLVERTDQCVQVIGNERQLERNVLQRQLRRLPQGANPGEVGEPDLDRLETVIPFEQRTVASIQSSR